MMKPIAHILPCVALALLSLGVSANEASGTEHGLVLLVDYEEPGRPSNTIRIIIENRSNKSMTVVSPADIRRPLGERGWWYCGSYQVFLHSADHGRLKYVCETPRPPVILPPTAPKLATLLPGQSVGALLVLPLPDHLNVSRPSGARREPPLPCGLNWEQAAMPGESKPPQSGFAITVEYSPVEYQSVDAPAPGPSDPEATRASSLVPEPVPLDKAIESNTLHYDGKNQQLHGK